MISPRVGFRVPRASMKATYVCHTTAPILGGGTYNCTDGTGDRFSAFPVVKNCTYTMECNLCPDGEFVVDEDVTAIYPLDLIHVAFFMELQRVVHPTIHISVNTLSNMDKKRVVMVLPVLMRALTQEALTTNKNITR